jgi:hypothetical protein
MAGYKRLPSQYASNLRRRIASDDGFQLLGSNKSAGYFVSFRQGCMKSPSDNC